MAAIVIAFLLLLSCSKIADAPVQEKQKNDPGIEAQNKKEMEEIRKSIRGELKIKVKRDGKGSYTWEITGKDAQEILKTNDVLKKRLVD